VYAHIEPAVGLLRVFDDGAQFGDPYIWSCTVKHLDEHSVELCGVCKPVTPSIWRAIRDLLVSEGVTQAHFDRHAGAKMGRHVILKKGAETPWPTT
jgi:hypothetical protein